MRPCDAACTVKPRCQSARGSASAEYPAASCKKRMPFNDETNIGRRQQTWHAADDVQFSAFDIDLHKTGGLVDEIIEGRDVDAGDFAGRRVEIVGEQAVDSADLTPKVKIAAFLHATCSDSIHGDVLGDWWRCYGADSQIVRRRFDRRDSPGRSDAGSHEACDRYVHRRRRRGHRG